MKTEFTKEEWFEVAKIARPGITAEEYEVMWEGFQSRKQVYEKNTADSLKEIIDVEGGLHE